MGRNRKSLVGGGTAYLKKLKEGGFGQKVWGHEQDGEAGGGGPCWASGLGYRESFVLNLRTTGNRKLLIIWQFLICFYKGQQKTFTILHGFCFYRKQACTKAIKYMLRSGLQEKQK